jgi:hypothetical protein
MHDIDSILAAEQRHDYRLDNPEILAFATLTQIAHENATRLIKKRFFYAAVVCLLAVLLAFEVIVAGQFSFNELGDRLSHLLIENPFAFTILNGGLVVAALAMKRLRLF